MDKIIYGILRHNKLVIVIFLVLAALSAIAMLGVDVNYNMVDYLPEDANSTIALSVMEEEFTSSVPNASVMVESVSVYEAAAYKEQLRAINGVSEVLWLDDVVDIKTPLAVADQATVEAYYKDGAALYSVTIEDGMEQQALADIYTLIGEGGAASGDAVDTATMQSLSVSEVLNALLYLVPVILIILLLSTGAWFEPVLFIGAIGISVLLNMGTNIIFGEISFMTNSVSPILQLAVSMDYAIFLLHSFETYRQETDDVREAMARAMRRSLKVVLASALTTFFGFLVLVLMQFRIGADLGIALAKGIVLSLISVMVFLPALTLSCYKLLDKTKHRNFMPSFKKAGSFVAKLRIPAIVLVLVLVVPAFLAQNKNTFTYGSGDLAADTRSGRDAARIEARFGSSTPMVLLVPRGDVVKEKALVSALGGVQSVTSVVAYVNMVGAEIPDAFLEEGTRAQFYSENYARIILYADTPGEGEEAFRVVEEARFLAQKYYGDAALSLGTATNLYDMRNVVTKDNETVNMIAIAVIAFVILVSFRSLSLPILLVLTIEAAIWINLAIPYFTGMAINYIGFLVINTAQLGATVDYAILYSDHYMDCRQRMRKKEAASQALSETISSVLVSGGILSITGFMLALTSTNSIVSGLGSLLGRGTLLSMAMVFLFLPAVLTLLDKAVEKTTLKMHFLPARSDKK